MHPKRIFALFYTGGLLVLLWFGIARLPDLGEGFITWIQTDHRQ